MTATIATMGAFSTVAGYGGNYPDPNGVPQSAPGGASSALNLTGPQVIKASPGRLCTIVIVAGGTSSGAFTFNDCATTAAAAAANEIITIPEGATDGTVYTLNWPCINGIVCSAVPGAGSPICSVSFN